MKKYKMKNYGTFYFITIGIVLYMSIVLVLTGPVKRSNGECKNNIECPANMSCNGKYCIDPCTWLTQTNSLCTVVDHEAKYTCKPGWDRQKPLDITICDRKL